MAESEPEPVAERVEPVFFMNSDVDQEESNYLTVWEICTAVSEVVSGGKKAVDGAQTIGGGDSGECI